ncbi:DivIVA domain-containing protein [Agrococcus sp. SL85]|nr:DivIVA domain-containing protein [Agrococcus sp. SL85]WAC67416.1 DivIVA domain-containing protein [Agrococcus sp. SL85]
MRELATPGPTEPLLTADRVALIRFTGTRFRRGYEPAQVDALLAELAEALRAHEARTAGGSPAS